MIYVYVHCSQNLIIYKLKHDVEPSFFLLWILTYENYITNYFLTTAICLELWLVKFKEKKWYILYGEKWCILYAQLVTRPIFIWIWALHLISNRRYFSFTLIKSYHCMQHCRIEYNFAHPYDHTSLCRPYTREVKGCIEGRVRLTTIFFLTFLNKKRKSLIID